MPSFLRAGLAVVLLSAAGNVAQAQTVYTWNETATDWLAEARWSPAGATNWAVAANNYIGAFGVRTQTAVTPTIASGSTAFALGVSINNGGAGAPDWSIDGTGTLSLNGTGLFTPGTPANARGLDIFGGGTTTIAPAITVAANGQAWYVTSATTAIFNGQIAAGSNTLILRVANDSVIQLNQALSGTGLVRLTNHTGGSAAPRFEIGADNAFGTGALETSAGGGGSVALRAVGGDRTLGNTAYNMSNYSLVVDGGNSLTLTGTVQNGTDNSNRTITSNTTGGAALKLNGQVSIRNPTDNTAGLTVTLILTGTGRTEIAGNIVGGGTGNGGQVSAVNIGSSTVGPTVRLSGANTYNGTTQVLAGTLLLGSNAPVNAAGSLGNNASSISVGNLSGALNSSVLTDGNVTIARGVNVRSGNTGIPTVGANAANSTSSFAQVSLGTGASATAKNLQLTSAANATTTINLLNRFTGYTGDATLTKVGPGTVVVGSTDSATSGINALVNVAAGTLQANGTFDARRGITVAAGATLIVNGNLSPDGTTNALVVNGTLAGGGVINHPVTVNAAGIFAPGPVAGIGPSTLANALTLEAGGTLALRLDDPTTGTSDRVNATGTVNFKTSGSAPKNAIVKLSGAGFVSQPDGTPAMTYLVATTGGVQVNGAPAGDAVIGEFKVGVGDINNNPVAFDVSALTGLNQFDRFLLSVSGTDLFVTYAPVPEPGLVLGLGALTVAALRRRRA